MRAVLILTLMVTASGASAQMTFQDGTFFDADWNITIETFNHPTGGSSTHEATGGNPDEHRANYHGSCMGNNPCRIWTVGMRVGAEYDPSTQGAIGMISYSEDQKCATADGCVLQGIAGRPALMQGGTVYLSAAPNSNVANNWQTLSLTGLVATDFGELALSATTSIDFGSNPDFSMSGSTIQFGFARGNSLIAFERTNRIDNWRVDVVPAIIPVTDASWGTVKALYD